MNLTHVHFSFCSVQVDFGILSEDACCVRLSCKATRNTWSHQRKRRRLKLRLAKLSQQATLDPSPKDGSPITVETERTVEPRQELESLASQLEELSTPCRMEFQLTVSVGEGASNRSSPEPPPTKRMKEAAEASSSSDRCVMATLELVRGDAPDQLHQIVQYLKNQLPSPPTTISPPAHDANS